MQERLLQSLLFVLMINNFYIIPYWVGRIMIRIDKDDYKRHHHIDIWVYGVGVTCLVILGVGSVVLWAHWVIYGN